MQNIAIVALVLLIIALVLSVAMIVSGFKVSRKMGLTAVLALLFLTGGMAMLCYFSYEVALSTCGEAETRQRGDQETQEKIDALENMENIDLGL